MLHWSWNGIATLSSLFLTLTLTLSRPIHRFQDSKRHHGQSSRWSILSRLALLWEDWEDSILSKLNYLYQGANFQTSKVSLGVLLALCWLTAVIRFYIRLSIQKAVWIDDGFLLFGLVCLTASVGLAFTFLDEAYTEESFLMGQTILAFQSGFVQLSFDYQKLVATMLILSWIAICSVKLSFLFLLRKLIDRLYHVLIYWWIVLIFVLATSGYGISVYLLACPYFYSIKARKSLEDAVARNLLTSHEYNV